MSHAIFMGPVAAEGRAMYQRAREAGISPLRSLILGNVASFKDCWAFRRKLADFAKCSVRTVQRALTQAVSEGLIGKARNKPGEKPPNWDNEVPCGWSHRWTIGWGAAAKEVAERVAAAKARWLVKVAVQTTPTKAPGKPAPAGVAPKAQPTSRPEYRRKMTAQELDAELERLSKPPPD